MTATMMLRLTIAGFPSPNVTMQTNDYASLSSGYSSGVSTAARCNSFVQPLFNQPWHKLQASLFNIIV